MDFGNEHRATFASAEHEGRNPLTNVERTCRDTVFNVENGERCGDVARGGGGRERSFKVAIWQTSQWLRSCCCSKQA